MNIELVPLATVELKVGAPLYIPNAAGGARIIADILDASWSGERLNARQAGRASGEWGSARADGTGTMDVRATLKTHDDALIYVHYQGRAITRDQVFKLYTAPLFETGDPRYAWLNSIQAVAKGSFKADESGGSIVTYQVYEVR